MLPGIIPNLIITGGRKRERGGGIVYFDIMPLLVVDVCFELKMLLAM